MGKQPVLSIIIPVYNGNAFIERTIMSILSQPSNDFEIIIVNDGSTDDSLKKIKECALLSERIKIISTENNGVCHARNIGIDIANGMYYLFFDQDDILLKDSYNEMFVNRLKQYYIENIDVFGFRTLKSNSEINQYYSEEQTIQTQYRDHVYMFSGLPIHFSLYHSRLFKEKNIHFMESRYVDLDMQFCHFLYYNSDKIIIDNNVLFYCWVIHQESTGHNRNNLIFKYSDSMKYWKAMADIHLSNSDKTAANYCYSYMCGVYLWLLKEYYKDHFFGKKIKTLLSDLGVEEIVMNYKKIAYEPVVEELDEYYNRKLVFVFKNRIEKYKRKIGLWAAKRIKPINKKYIQKKYPYTIDDVYRLVE